MKFYDVLKKLEKDKKGQFKIRGDRKLGKIMLDSGGVLVWQSSGRPLILSLSILNSEWEAVEREISIEDAVKYWAENKNIICRMPLNDTRIIEPSIVFILSREMILDAKWYLPVDPNE